MIDDRTWDALCALLEEAWPGKFDDDAARAWRVLLGGFNAAAIAEGVQRLLLEGHEFRPSVSQLVAAIRRDPSRPTFAEALRLVDYCLRARPERTGAVTTYDNEADRRRRFDNAVLERARSEQVHPLVGAFVARQGVERLRTAGLTDPDYGGARRAQLEREWHEHVDTFDGREVAALAQMQARGTGGQLQRFDPLAALERGRVPLVPIEGGGAPATLPRPSRADGEAAAS